jgi:3-hydroxyisobutyrate dehydrogenase-like beta-hydroxyacid dehydrogenase
VTIGFAGLGIMGSRMAANLRRSGFELVVYNRTTETARTWADEHGAEVVTSPRELAERSDIVISMVVDETHVDEVMLGPDGVVHGAREGLLVIDCSTISPTDTRRIGAALAERGVHMLDAPVTGSAPKAQDGTLTIMVGGEAEDLERARPVLEAMGTLIVHVGPLGQGEMLKLINNSVAAANCSTVAQALLVAKKTGVDLDALQTVMAAGSGGSAMLELKAGPMREHDYTTLFKLEHMLKDVRLCLEEGQAAGIGFPSAADVREVLSAAMGRGHADDDFAAMIEVLEGYTGTRL